MGRKLPGLAVLVVVLGSPLFATSAAAAHDGCPQSDDFEGPCPVLHFAPHYKVTDRAVQVKVKTSIGARIAVSGVLPGLGTSMGTRQTIAAGKFVPFRLAIPPALNERLHRLGPSRSLRVQLVARVNHVTGNVSTARLVVHIPGR
jgi:hypothetical protein